jgi:hypothetical protein
METTSLPLSFPRTETLNQFPTNYSQQAAEIL